MYRSIPAACLLFLLSFPLFAQAPVDLNEMRVKTATKAREMTIGRQASRRFERQISLVKSVAVLEYVSGIAKKVAASSDVAVPVTIKIVDSGTVNALSFPGGFLYVTSGLIFAVDDETEIAGVIAHEIAHVAARDGMKNSSYLGTGTAAPVNVPAPDDGASGLTDFGGYLVPLRFVTPPRETDADRRAIPYLHKAGYDARGLLAFLQKMQAREKTELNSSVIGLFQTHPPTAERIRLVEEQIGELHFTPDSNADTTTELKKAQARLMEYEAEKPYAQ